ncbi:MAG: metallophosphoesterase [Lachnospiraceae bacterium]|nr:metallophosphoesterase [Lachnospiraceae bacterium]
MKILVVSDTHGRLDNFRRVMEMHKPDLLIHCGDIEGQEAEIIEIAGCPVRMVAGNNDYFSDLPGEVEFTAGGQKIWVTHGHHYYVSMSSEYIAQEAMAREVDVAMFGHTHKPCVENRGGLVILNPGSLSYPRQEGREPSYIIMEDDRKGDWHYTIAYLRR